MHDHDSYRGPRPDLLAQVGEAHAVLDVGCNNGAVARALKARQPGVKVWGIEINEAALAQAKPDLVQGWVSDLDTTDLGALLGTQLFDHIIAGDVLEHTVHYQRITAALYRHLAPAGRLIISVPNYGHWHTLWVWLTQRWQRNERGIFDKTHRSIFMRRNLGEFAAQCPGARWRLAKRNFRFFETNRHWKLNMLVTYTLFPLLLLPYVRDFVTLSYVITIDKPGSPQ